MSLSSFFLKIDAAQLFLLFIIFSCNLYKTQLSINKVPYFLEYAPGALIKFFKEKCPNLPNFGDKNLLFSRSKRIQMKILRRSTSDMHAFILEPLTPSIRPFKKLFPRGGALIQGRALIQGNTVSLLEKIQLLARRKYEFGFLMI